MEDHQEIHNFSILLVNYVAYRISAESRSALKISSLLPHHNTTRSRIYFWFS